MRKIGEREILFAPDQEGGVDNVSTDTNIADTGTGGDADSGPSDSGGEAADEAPQKLSVRDEIKKAMEDVTKAEQPKPKRAAKAAPTPDSTVAALAGQTQAQQTIPAPARLTKEAKAEWDKAPETIKQAFVKAEQDMQAGVQQLQERYALIDQAIAPHADALRQMNATPGEAVNRMFLWFKALAGSPREAFPALAQSMGFDWNKVIAQQAQQQPQQGQPGQGGAPAVPDEMKQYIGRLEHVINAQAQQLQALQGGFTNIQQDIQNQQMQKTEENLNIWSNGKEFFQEVRQDMARLIQADPNLIKNGQVDLDAAYERAIYYNPEVRAKVLAKQQQANQQVQQQATDAATTARNSQVAKAKKAAVSLPVGNAPGEGVKQSAQHKPQGKSVRDAIKAAMAELRDQ